MGSLPPDTPCGWCGRRGAGYIPDGIDPPVPLCTICLWGSRDRQEVMFNAVYHVLFFYPDPYGRGRLFFAEPDVLWHVAAFL